MRLSNQGLEIEISAPSNLFPADFIIVDWECEAEELFDMVYYKKFYEFEDIEMKCFYYDSENELIEFKPTLDQEIFITPFIETDAENELEKQK